MTKLFLLIFLICTNANAGLNIGTSISYFKNNDPVYKYVDKPVNSFNYGYNKELNKFNINLSTNRLLNWDSKKEVKKGGTVFYNRTKIEYEALQLGYRVDRIISYMFIANTHIKKKIYYKGILKGKSNNDAIAYGVGASYLLTRRLICSVSAIMPNEEMHWGSSLSINYLF